MSGRRQFLHDAASNLAALATVGLVPGLPAVPPTDEWDLGWPERLAGKRRAVFDAAEIESGFGVYRAAVWTEQTIELLGVAPTDVSAVIVLRAHAVVLALQQSFWDQYGVGRLRQVTHPVSLKDTSRNPVLMDARDGLPPRLVRAALTQQLARGVTVLACDLALQTWIDAIRERDRLSQADARRQVLAALVPGIIPQPSGVLAAILAQEHGCAYVRAS